VKKVGDFMRLFLLFLFFISFLWFLLFFEKAPSRLLFVNGSGCPFSFESFVGDGWDKVCFITPYVGGDEFEKNGLNEKLTVLDDERFRIAFYASGRVLESFSVRNVGLGVGRGVSCYERGKAVFELRDGVIYLKEK